MLILIYGILILISNKKKTEKVTPELAWVKQLLAQVAVGLVCLISSNANHLQKLSNHLMSASYFSMHTVSRFRVSIFHALLLFSPYRFGAFAFAAKAKTARVS